MDTITGPKTYRLFHMSVRTISKNLKKIQSDLKACP
jgi:hypothetical protein